MNENVHSLRKAKGRRDPRRHAHRPTTQGTGAQGSLVAEELGELVGQKDGPPLRGKVVLSDRVMNSRAMPMVWRGR